MPEQYNESTTKILELWIDKLKQNAEIEPLLVEKISEMVRTGQAGAESEIQEIVTAIKGAEYEQN